jgi:hypothetical protein
MAITTAAFTDNFSLCYATGLTSLPLFKILKPHCGGYALPPPKGSARGDLPPRFAQAVRRRRRAKVRRQPQAKTRPGSPAPASEPNGRGRRLPGTPMCSWPDRLARSSFRIAVFIPICALANDTAMNQPKGTCISLDKDLHLLDTTFFFGQRACFGHDLHFWNQGLDLLDTTCVAGHVCDLRSGSRRASPRSLRNRSARCGQQTRPGRAEHGGARREDASDTSFRAS